MTFTFLHLVWRQMHVKISAIKIAVVRRLIPRNLVSLLPEKKRTAIGF